MLRHHAMLHALNMLKYSKKPIASLMPTLPHALALTLTRIPEESGSLTYPIEAAGTQKRPVTHRRGFHASRRSPLVPHSSVSVRPHRAAGYASIQNTRKESTTSPPHHVKVVRATLAGGNRSVVPAHQGETGHRGLYRVEKQNV